MTLSIKSFSQKWYLFAFLLVATLVVNAKAKIETPKKRTEVPSSKPVTALRVPFLLRTPTLMSKSSLPLSLDPVRFTLQANKDTLAEGEEVEITITAQLLDIPASSFFIFEEQKSFSIKLLIPKGFTQTGGDYQEYIGAQLNSQNKTFSKSIRGVFTSIPENPCFTLLRGAYNANSSGVFEQKQVLCFTKKAAFKATREADCTTPVLTPIAPQTICFGGAFYMVSTNITNGVEAYYQWYNDNGTANNNTNPIANEQRANLRSFPTAPGVYKYKIVATSAANATCSASQSVTLTVNAPPTITSTTSTNPSCTPAYGGTISVVGAGGTALLYSKDDGGTWVDLTGLNAQDEITRNTMLYATEKDIARVKITLEEGFGLGPGGEYTGEIRNQTTIPVFEGLAAGTYNIRVKNENGCISVPTPVTLTNPNAPAIFSVTGGGTCIANGASINLSGSATGINYSLLRNGVIITAGVAGTGTALSFGNQTTVGTYTVMATNATTNCSAIMNNSAVISNTPPAAPIIDTETTVVCAGQSAVLTDNSTCAGTLVWTPLGGTLTNNSHTYTVTPTTTTTYSAKCQINSCISDISNSIQLTVTTLSAPVITGASPLILCPDNTVTLVATGCSSTVAWTYTLTSGATGTLTFTGNTLNLTYANSGISAWNDGDGLSLRAACTALTCTSTLSSAVEVVKQASCSNALSDCAFYIKAADAQGTETTKLTRTGAGVSTFQPLTLSAQTLEATSPTGVTYSWTGPGITTPLTTAQISATQVGEYKLTLSSPTGGGQVGVCELYITLSGTPCTIPTSAACGIPANITPSDQGGPYLASLAPGDQFTANDYVITVTSVTSSTAGAFIGEGYARMKLTNGFSIDVPVVFGQSNGSGTTTTATPIKLNTCYQLVDGTVFTQYDPSWGNIADVSEIYQSVNQSISDIKELAAIYNGSNQDKNTVDNGLSEIEKQINDNPFISDASKVGIKTKYDEIATLWNTLKECKASATALRLSAENTETCPSQSALEAKLTELEGLINSTQTFEIFNTDPTEGANFSNENIDLIYITPAGKPYLLPLNAIPIFDNNTKINIVEGCLMGFKIGGTTFQARFEQKNGKPYFLGYFTNQTASNRGNIYPNFSGQKLRNIYEHYQEQQTSANSAAVVALIGSASISNNGQLALGVAGSTAKTTVRTVPTTALNVFKNLGVMSWVMQGVKELFMSPALDVYVGDGSVATVLPIRAYEYEQTLPTSLSSQVTIAHKLPNDGGKGCGVYTIWSVSVSNPTDLRIEKYGMTCQENNGCPIDIRPHEQCRDFNKELDGRFYNWSWVIPNNPGVSKEVAHLVEKTLTAGYVIANFGNLPRKHKLPCFVKKSSDIFKDRVDLANKHINDSISKYGSR